MISIEPNIRYTVFNVVEGRIEWRKERINIYCAINSNIKIEIFRTFVLTYLLTNVNMGWFSKDTSSNVPTNQVQQRSHQPLDLSGQPAFNSTTANSNGLSTSSDISHTLDQLTEDQTPLKLRELKENTVKANNESVAEFVHQRPKNLFVIDGEKEIEESIICTNNEQGGKTCLKLKYNSVQLFKQMQKLEYFCSLPDDINATYFECRKIT